MARALAAVETRAGEPQVLELLSQAWSAPKGHVLGLTGPPGVGKSTLTNALIAAWRSEGKTVGVIAVDPSSRRTGGALLGDRARLKTDPEDQGIFVRSMAARDRLGGLAALTVSAMVLMRSVYDIVLVETVGVGQSETEVADVTDTIVFCIQPGSGDSLQFMKAGIMEVPHIMVVTKADMGAAARRARSDVEGALSLNDEQSDHWPVEVHLVSAPSNEGVEELTASINKHWSWLNEKDRLAKLREDQSHAWAEDAIRDRFGREGLLRAFPMIEARKGDSPFAIEADVAASLLQGMKI